ncbi:MAG: hypothetical protein R3Y63_04425 [Eubacteriales bacterium]
MSFYYKSGGIFEYRPQKRFTTHNSYAKVPHKYTKGEKQTKIHYLTESEIKETKPDFNFYSDYEEIKMNCETSKAQEANAISALYQYNFTSHNDIIFFDTEVVPDKGSNRIDLAFYNKTSGLIAFCEAKYIKNTGILKKKEVDKSTIGQILRYNKELENPEKVKYILRIYKDFVEQSNQLYGTNLPEPKNIFPRVSLLILGGTESKNSELEPKVEKLYTPHKISYMIQETATNIDEIFQAITKGD